MDPFEDLLRGLRADGAGFRRAELSPPWTLRPGGAAALTLYAPLRGEGWLRQEEGGGEPLRVVPGDLAIVREPGPFVLADRPSPGADPAEGTVLLTAAYPVRGTVARRLHGLLPPVVVAPGGDGCASLLDVLEAQAGACPPGQQVVRDRLLDWLLVCSLRGWFDRPGAAPSGWFHALGDATVGPVLRAMHAAPERPWTLATLAAQARVSRTTLAERFTRLVGEPPLTYLTDWRMTLAADLLTGSTEKVGAVARRAGYADAFGFSAAFKRFHGVSPSAYRANCWAEEGCSAGAEVGGSR
ncbi:AraC family transcriptional regulator [Streptomyces avicenniae]|uniref:AraC family transcriptional regulator n=1 Tax=Streptomyces avicenniae TaxID=500153 RepID=UPI00069A9A71|nr:AraC family transcriptional regulator [Streptomyces avicenniae]